MCTFKHCKPLLFPNRPCPCLLTRCTAAYAGYSKTSYGAQGGDDSGGFFAGGSQPGSQGGKVKKKALSLSFQRLSNVPQSYQDESLRPVTVKQILEADEAFSGADFKIDNTAITQITFVGQVRNINPQPTNVTLKIDDGTGQIEVKKWIDADKADDGNADQYELDSYVRVWGRLKSFSNKRHVGAHVIRPVTDFNEVNYHLLEATYVHLYLTRGPLGQDGAANGGGESMFVDGGAYGGNANGGGSGQMLSKVSGCGPLAKRMFNFMNGTPGMNEGVHLNVISSSTGMSVRDVLAAADELLGQGLIYTTVDDETWAILEC